MSQNNRDTTQPHAMPPIFQEFKNLDVVNELAKLRQEIQWLREMLIPPKSALIIGPEVERVLKEIVEKHK